MLAPWPTRAPDPAWIPGIHDAADYDDVVLLVSSDAGGIAPGALSTIQPLPRMVETLGPSHESAPDPARVRGWFPRSARSVAPRRVTSPFDQSIS